MNPLTRLARRGQRPATTSSPERLGGADAGPGALSTLELPASVRLDDDPFASERFTVDLEDRAADSVGWARAAALPPLAFPAPEETSEPAEAEREPIASGRRLLLRLALVVVLSAVAFHHNLASLARTIATGSALLYVAAVPLFAALALAAVGRRCGRAPAGVARVRVGDLFLGVALCSVALVGTTLVGPGLSGVFFVWRLDLLGLWIFLVGAGVAAFGTRRVADSWPFWVVLVLIWPFPLRLVNVAIGSAVGGAVVLTIVVLTVIAYGHRAGDPARRGVLVSAALPAAVLLAASGIAAHPTRTPWPAVAAALVAAVWWQTHAGAPLDRPIVERRTRGTVPALVALTVVGLVVLPAAPRPAPISLPTGITSLAVGPLDPPGWATMTSEPLPEQRFFGAQSSWRRLELREGIAGVGPFIGGRDIVVDVVSTPRPQTFAVYPVVTTYAMGTLSATPDAVVDLGHGVDGQLYRAEDTRTGVPYTLLTFTWQLPVDLSLVAPYVGPPVPATQRVTLIALDDPDPEAPFPMPGNATLDGIGAALDTGGSGRSDGRAPLNPADAKLLVDTALRLVDQRLTGG